jgi:hypothetical protein
MHPVKTHKNWWTRFRERFPPRPELTDIEAYQKWWADLPERDVLELFELIEDEYGVPGGFFLPSDPLRLFFEPVKTRNPFLWMTYQVRAGDREFALNEAVWRRRGTRYTGRVKTFRDLVLAWCGRDLDPGP